MTYTNSNAQRLRLNRSRSTETSGHDQRNTQVRHPDVVAIRADQRKTFRVRDDYPLDLRAQVDAIYHAPSFYRDLAPIAGAVEGAKAMLNAGIDVRICTSPLDAYRHCVPEKYEWVERYLGHEFVRRIVVTKDKSLILGDVLIDDNPEIPVSRPPAWCHVVYDQPYNGNHVGPRVTWKSWEAILDPNFLVDVPNCTRPHLA
ncbi:5' nucleotidase, NT5C type [Dokdonella sp.]|uniref:5' nucleotidase, NT5C type n=1 Tax=Dokdonella sp. TaxID=2291710 RepID=UPI0039C8B7F1